MGSFCDCTWGNIYLSISYSLYSHLNDISLSSDTNLKLFLLQNMVQWNPIRSPAEKIQTHANLTRHYIRPIQNPMHL